MNASTEPDDDDTTIFSRRRRIVVTVVAALAIAALAVGSVLGGVAIATNGSAETDAEPSSTSVAAPSATATPTPTVVDTARPVPASGAAAAAIRSCSVADLAADPRLANFQARVEDAATGAVLYDRGGSNPSRTASVLKVLTTAAALNVLGPDRRITTTVVRGDEPGTVVLVGGGDLTLSSLPTGSSSVYEGAAHLDDLAEQVQDAWDADPANDGVPISNLVLDASLFAGDTWQPSWDRKEQTDGYMPEITALQVDGDRDDPTATVSERSDDPVARAGAAFAEELGGDITVSEGTATAGAATLGSVQSQPVSTLVQQTLIVSDNTIAEMLARLTAIESGAGNTFAAEQQGTLAGLVPYGIDTTGIVIADGSGLSPDNAVAPAYLTELLRQVQNRVGSLGSVYDGLPISGETGSLSYSDRFTGAAADADGAVHAKTGWIDTGYTLAGIIDAADGSTLTFAIYALGDVTDSAKQAIDSLAAGFYRCGADLSDL